jgi:hypothetical protein
VPRLIPLFLLLVNLYSCAAPVPSASPTPSATATITPTLTPTATPTELATATITDIPKPSGWENLPQNVSPILNADGSWGISVGNEVKPIPGAVFDSTGLHMTLDTGRTIDIPVNELQTKLAFDQDLNLLQIFDTENIISAEYDGGVGQPDSPEYVAGQGWVDIQELAKTACDNTMSCFFENVRNMPINTVTVNFTSTGIFKKN